MVSRSLPGEVHQPLVGGSGEGDEEEGGQHGDPSAHLEEQSKAQLVAPGVGSEHATSSHGPKLGILCSGLCHSHWTVVGLRAHCVSD